MKRLLSILLILFSFCAALAQSQFESYILRGDVMMKQQFYEPALKHYSKAREIAASDNEITTADARIAECKRAMAKAKEASQALKSNASRLLYTDFYYENGDEYSEEEDHIYGVSYDFQETGYEFKVYTDRLIIVRHIDIDDGVDVEDDCAGTVLKCKKETSAYRVYYSDSENVYKFYKKDYSNSFGKYRRAEHIVGGVHYYLYSSNEWKQLTSFTEGADSENLQTDSSNREVESCLSFTDGWTLNVDKEGNRLGDTRCEPICARDACYLLFRMRYDYSFDFVESVGLSIKLFNPQEVLMRLDGAEVKTGFTCNETLDTLPGGGIFNVLLGQDSPGSFKPGLYRLEIWSGTDKLYTYTVELM